MKRISLVIFVSFLFSCSSKVPDFSNQVVGGKLAVKIKNRGITVCKFISEDEKSDVACINPYTDTKYLIPFEEWEKEIKYDFGLYSHKQVISILSDQEFLRNTVPDLFEGREENLEKLREFIYEWKNNHQV